VALLGEKLKRERPDYSVVNASISGETSSGGASRIGAALQKHRPAVLVLELGANDGLRGLPVAQLEKNLDAMAKAAGKTGAKVLILGMKMPPNYGPDYSRQFEQAFARAAKANRAALLPFFLQDFADRPEYFQADRIHPTEAAQPMIVDRVWPALRPLLR